MNIFRRIACVAVVGGLSLMTTAVSGQVVVYRPVVTMFAPAAGPYVANYTPAGNYAAVSAYSPPIMETVAMPVAAAPVVAEVAAPVTAYYAPTYVAPTYAAPVATTTYYAPAAPAVVAAPVTAYYAPAAVAVPLYRRGLFGAYRPVRVGYYPYY